MIDKKVILLGGLVFLLKIFGTVNKYSAILTFFLLVFFVFFLSFVKKKEYSIIPLMCTDGVNYYYSIDGYLHIILPLVIFLVFITYRKFGLNNKEFMAIIFLFILQVALYFNHSIDVTGGDYLNYLLLDIRIFLCIIFGYWIFKGSDFELIEKSILVLVISNVMYIFFGNFVLDFQPYRLNELGIGVGYSPFLFFAYCYLSAKLVLSSEKIIYFILLLLLIMLCYFNSIISSQNLLSIPIVIFYCFFLTNRGVVNRTLVSILGITIFFSLPILNEYFMANYEISSDVETKFRNVSSLFSSLENIYSMSHSVQVRSLELMNIAKEADLISIIIGKGVGSSFSDINYSFSYLNDYDFSFDQISSSTYYTPHNLAYFFLKFGFISFFVALFIPLLLKNRDSISLGVPLFCFGILNLAFSLLPSIMLGIFFALIKQELQNVKK